MSIIIIGAGQIGEFIASKLSGENKDVVIIEEDEKKIAEISEELDVQCIQGNGASPATLREAGIDSAQMLIAVTDSDEVNLLACTMANLQNEVPIKVARVRQPEFSHRQDQDIIKKLDIDMIINPDKEAADTILRVLSVPGSVDVLDFFGGKIQLIGVRVKGETEITGIYLEKLNETLKEDFDLLITAILRDGQTIIPSGKNRILPGDLVYFITKSERVKQVMSLFGFSFEKGKRVMINGGGFIGLYLSQILEQNDIQVKVVEPDNKICSTLVRNLDKSIILNEHITEQNFLIKENIKDMDAFISVTPDDENNILSSLLAKRLGTPWTITLTNQTDYIPLITTIGIDVVISPRLIANGAILHFIRRGKVLSVASLQEDIEIMEIEALETSDIVNRPISKSKLPKGSLIICLERKGEIMIPHGDTVIEHGDKVLVQCTRESISRIEKLFTVKLEYF